MSRISMTSMATTLLVGAAFGAPLLTASLAKSQATTKEDLFVAPWRAFDAGTFPTFAISSLAIGDIDGDDDIDVVAGRDYFGGPGFSVLRSEGDGFFAPPEIYELPFMMSVGDVSLTDMDGDADLDVIATLPDANGQTNIVSVWRNDGTGVFGVREDFVTGPGPLDLVVADFTGDQFPDIITANFGYIAGTNNTISLLEHNGRLGAQAGFNPPVTFNCGDKPVRLVAADIDHDNDLDLAVGRQQNSNGVSILFNDGTGAFSAPTEYTAAPGAYVQSTAVALADMNNDTHLDLISAGAENEFVAWGQIVIRHNNGSGTFGAPVIYDLEDWTYNIHSLATADLNGDNFLDIIASTPSGRTYDGYNVMLSNGSGGYLAPRRYDAGKQTHELVTLDVNGDQAPDLLTAANDSSVLTVHKNLGDGTFFVPQKFQVGFLSTGMDSGDIDHDGDRDIVTADGVIQILRNRGDGTFDPAEAFDLPIVPGEVWLRDMDNDTYLDLLIGPDRCCPPYHFAVALNRRDGTFAPAVVTPINASQGGQIGAFDLDNDTFLDVALTDPGPASVIYIARNNGSGTSYSLMNSIHTAGLPWCIDGADLNHDTFVDLVSSTASGLTVFTGNGDFTFGDEIATGVPAYRFQLTDLDQDGEKDLAVMLPQPSFGTVELGAMFGYGDGGFTFPDYYPGPTGRESAFRISSWINTGDLNRDGFPEIVLTNNAPNDVSIFPSNGDGTLAPMERYGAGYSPHLSTLGDFDGDGIIDIASVSGSPEAVVVLKGTGAGGPPITLDQTPLRRGQNATFSVSGAEPSELVYVVYSRTGTGAGPCPPQLGGLCVDILDPVVVLGSALADVNGTMTLTQRVPANAPLVAVHTQAVIRRGVSGTDSVKSNTVSSTITP